MNRPFSRTLALGLVCAVFLALYWPVFASLIRDWTHDDNYSHGFFIIPLAAYFVWDRRKQLAVGRGSAWGLVAVVLSIGALLAGLFGAEAFLTRASMIGVVAGAVLFTTGWSNLKLLAFPLGFLFLMIPLPAIVFNEIAFPLQLVASQAGETVLRFAGIPVLREGNVIIMANTTLEVAEACSGIRSLISLLTLSVVYAYFSDSRTWVRVVVTLGTVPIAIAVNASRVAGTGLAAHRIGASAAEGFFHTFSGWLVFVAGIALLFLMVRIVQSLSPPSPPSPQGATAIVTVQEGAI